MRWFWRNALMIRISPTEKSKHMTITCFHWHLCSEWLPVTNEETAVNDKLTPHTEKCSIDKSCIIHSHWCSIRNDPYRHDSHHDNTTTTIYFIVPNTLSILDSGTRMLFAKKICIRPTYSHRILVRCWYWYKEVSYKLWRYMPSFAWC